MTAIAQLARIMRILYYYIVMYSFIFRASYRYINNTIMLVVGWRLWLSVVSSGLVAFF